MLRCAVDKSGLDPLVCQCDIISECNYSHIRTFYAQCTDMSKVVVVDMCVDSEQSTKDGLDSRLEVVLEGHACEARAR